MGRHPEPLERMATKAKGDGRTPGHRLVVRPDAPSGRVCPVPPAPRGLAYRGKKEWHKIWSVGPWLNADQDYHWVEMICRAYDDIDIYRKRVEADGLVVTGYAGQTVAHPLVAEIRRCETTIRNCLSVLGYSPTDRARLKYQEVRASSGLEDLISKQAKNH